MSKIFQQIAKAAMILVAIFVMGFSLAGQAQGTIKDLDIIKVDCLIKGDFNDNTCLINKIIRFLVTIAPVFAVLVITWGGYMYFLGGLSGKADGAKTIQAGVIGLIITLTATFVATAVQAIFATDGQLNAKPVTDFITQIVDKLLIPIAAVMAILVITWGGYRFFFSGLDIDKEGGAKNIRNGITGLIVVLLAGFISSTVQAVFGNSGTFNSAPIQDFIQGILLNLLIPISGTLAVLVIAWGGYKYFFGGLDIDKEGGAKNIRNGVTGLVVVLLAAAAFNTAKNLATNLAGKSGADVITVLVNTFLKPLIEQGQLILFGLASAVAILVIMYGGYKYYFNGAGASKEDGLKNIRSGIIGLVTVLLAQIIVNLINSVFPQPGTAGATILNVEVAPIINAIRFFINSLLIPASIALSIFFFILGGYYYITAGGNAEKLKKAQKATINAAIGLVVVLLAATIIQLIVFVVGV